MPTVSTVKMTARQFMQMGQDPPGVRLELVDGEIAVSASPNPTHSAVLTRLVVRLGVYIEANQLGELLQDLDTEMHEYTVRRPDILYFKSSRTHFITRERLTAPPDLAVEVVSPGSNTVDRKDTFAEYARVGIKFYWIVDPFKRTFECWKLSKRRYLSMGIESGSAVARFKPFADLEIPLAKLWR